MNKYFDKRFKAREKINPLRYDISDDFYCRLEEEAKYYDASISKLINACLENLIESNTMMLYPDNAYELKVSHVIRLRESNVIALEDFKANYGINKTKIINTAIRATLNDDI